MPAATIARRQTEHGSRAGTQFSAVGRIITLAPQPPPLDPHRPPRRDREGLLAFACCLICWRSSRAATSARPSANRRQTSRDLRERPTALLVCASGDRACAGGEGRSPATRWRGLALRMPRTIGSRSRRRACGRAMLASWVLARPRAYGDCGSPDERRVVTGAEGGGTTGPMSPSGASSMSTITGA
jgi:hypothetical protein